MKLSFKRINTRDELLSRVDNGELSVGAFFKYIKHLLSDTKTDIHTERINVIYSATYGNHQRIYWV